MNLAPQISLASEAECKFSFMTRAVQLAAPAERLATLSDCARDLRQFIEQGLLDGAVVEVRIFEIADQFQLRGEPGSDTEKLIASLAREVTMAAAIDEDEAARELDIQLKTAALVSRWEAADPRDNPALIVGDEPPPPNGPEAYGQSPDGEPEPEGQGQDQKKTPPKSPPPLTLVAPTAWRGIAIPPMQWLATNRIPAGDATILSGDGGSGKTIVALQLAVAVERGLGDWLGTTCEQGPVIFFSAEEPEAEMRRRLHRVARKRGIEPDDIENLHFHFADPDSCLLGMSRPNGPMVPTPLFELLRSAAMDIRPALIVVDSIAATFGGNQNDRIHARTFVGMFRRLAQDAGCAVLLLDHPSLSGITNGTGRGGSVDWQNATRARLHLETVDDLEGGTDRVLEVKKTNYGPCGEKVKLRWEDGCFALQGAVAAPAQAAAHSSAERAYLTCLDLLAAQGREVREHPGRGYAPAMFAAMPEANGITPRAFKTAQDRLFSAGQIYAESVGPASKRTKRIARKPLEVIAEAAQ
jgi:RecA-family ATPase